MMETYTLNCNGAGFRTERGRLAIWAPAPNIVLCQLGGYGDVAFAEPIVGGLERALRADRPVRMFLDLDFLEDYDSWLRARLTSRFHAAERKIGTLALLARSKLMQVGVAVANLAFGDRLALHTERVTFEVDLEEALRAAGVAGFPGSKLLAA